MAYSISKVICNIFHSVNQRLYLCIQIYIILFSPSSGLSLGCTQVSTHCLFAHCSVLANYAKWIFTWQLADVLTSGISLREHIVHLKEAVMGKPSMEQRDQCVSTTSSVMPIALGRVYAQHILPTGYKVSYLQIEVDIIHHLYVCMDNHPWTRKNDGICTCDAVLNCSRRQ